MRSPRSCSGRRLLSSRCAVTAAACLVACALAACGRTPATGPLQWHPLQPGLEYARADAHTAAGGDVALHLVRLALERWELVLVDAAVTGVPLADARTFREAAGGVLAVNAGYFDPQFRPLGLRVSRGRQQGALRKVDHGVFSVADRRGGLQHAKQWVAPAGLEFALECGPRLLIGGGAPVFREATRARRTALGTDGHGRAVIVATDGALSLAELAAALARPEPQGGPGLVDALNLDGGSSTMFDLHVGARHVEVTAALGVPVGVAVVARR